MLARVRWALLLAACAACAPDLYVVVDVGEAKSALLVIPEGSSFRAVAADVAELAATPLRASAIDSAELYLFDRDLAALRLSRQPNVVVTPGCAADELDTAIAISRRCFGNDTFADCAPFPRRVSREPYMGQPCFEWSLEQLSVLEFDLDPPHSELATLLVSLGPDRVLLGQLSGGDTLIGVIDSADTLSSTVAFVGPRLRLPGRWRTAIARDARTAFLVGASGAVHTLDIQTGSIAAIIEPASAGSVVALAAAPDDPDRLLAGTDRCALLRRDGARWVELVPPTDLSLVDDVRCAPQIEWVGPDEAIAIGLFRGQTPRTSPAFTAEMRSVVRIRGDQLTVEPLPWSTDDPEGIVRGLRSYVAADSTRVDVVTGQQSHEYPFAGPTLKPWFIHDPRLGDGWVRLDDGYSADVDPITYLVRWGDGVIGTGGFTQAFSDPHWRDVPSAALSARVGSGLFIDRLFGLVADDGHGGFFIASNEETSERSAFVWRRQRR